MTKSRLPLLLMRIFTPRSPLEYVLKPAATWAVYLLVYVMLEVAVFGWLPIGLPERLFVITLTQLPFMAVAFILVTYLDGLQSGLANLAMTDVLTELPNRRAFIDQVSDIQRSGDTGYLLIIDADHFKQINDTYGHAIGDICLQAIAERLESLRTLNDVVGRIGGEEFGAFMPFSTKENIVLIGKKMCREIVVKHPDQPQPLRFTLSVGAAETQPKEPVETALARADEALYAAKENGRSQLVLWTKSLSDAA